MALTRGSGAGIVVPCLIMTIVVGWLLTVKGVVPGVDWVWVLGLGIAGSLVLVVGGIDKVTVVVGPFLLMATVFSVLRQTGRLSVDTEVPLLVIAIGGLMLFGHLAPVPPPAWLGSERKGSDA